MPVNKVTSSKRGKAAIASILAISIGGMVTLFGGTKVHEDTALAVEYLTEDWEGLQFKAYLDRIPKPPVWTICYGDTDNVKPGMVETLAGCKKRLYVKIERDYRAKLVTCVAQWDRQPLSWRATAIDLSWNLGPAGVCNSSGVGIVNQATKLGKKPDYRASCERFTLFNRSGGKVINGLVLRREMGDANRIGEAELCLSGI